MERTEDPPEDAPQTGTLRRASFLEAFGEALQALVAMMLGERPWRPAEQVDETANDLLVPWTLARECRLQSMEVEEVRTDPAVDARTPMAELGGAVFGIVRIGEEVGQGGPFATEAFGQRTQQVEDDVSVMREEGRVIDDEAISKIFQGHCGELGDDLGRFPLEEVDVGEGEELVERPRDPTPSYGDDSR